MITINKQDNERIGAYAQRLMVSGQFKNPDILAKIQEQFPEAKTTMACIAWYRSDLKKKNHVQPAEVDRTVDVIKAELEEAKQKVLDLEEEVKILEAAQAEELLAQEEELLAKLKLIKSLKKEGAKQE